MKQTNFIVDPKKKEPAFILDFIYEPPSLGSFVDMIVHHDKHGSFSVSKVIDEFTDNPTAHIRHIKLTPHEKQVL